MIDRLIWLVMGLIVLVNGHAIGLNSAYASCTTAECAEVNGYASFTQLTTTPRVSGSHFYGNPYAVVIKANSALGGSVETHNTITTSHDTNCQPVSRECAAQTVSDSYAASWTQFGTVPNNCQSQPAVKRTFCANTSGSGVTQSWHAGKKKDES